MSEQAIILRMTPEEAKRVLWVLSETPTEEERGFPLREDDPTFRLQTDVCDKLRSAMDDLVRPDCPYCGEELTEPTDDGIHDYCASARRNQNHTTTEPD